VNNYGHNTPSSGVDWNRIAQDELNIAKFNFPQGGTAKNVIVFVGDGLGVPTITAARRYMAENRGIPFGQRAALSFEDLPVLGHSMVSKLQKKKIF
jgi:alkaline phosphatase